MKKYDCVIAYRIYPKVSKKPFVYEENKLKLAELGLYSLKKSTEGLNIKFYIILDNCPAEYTEMINRIFNSEEIVIINSEVHGNANTFNLQMEILSEQNYSEYIYFAEDDYVYKPAEFEQMLDFIKTHSYNTFVTPYDHLDYYTHLIHKHKKDIIVDGKKHWLSVNSTCLTFLTTKTTLIKSKKIFDSYLHKNWDASLFLILTKKHLFNVFSFIKFVLSFIKSEKEPLMVFIKAWLNILKGYYTFRKYCVYAPIPSIATHMQYNSIAPNCNWEDLNKMYIEEIKLLYDDSKEI